jgi:hypothetical protein
VVQCCLWIAAVSAVRSGTEAQQQLFWLGAVSIVWLLWAPGAGVSSFCELCELNPVFWGAATFAAAPQGLCKHAVPPLA